MIIRQAVFITSAADQSGFRSFDKPIICVSGRSNVGKSSFINMLAANGKLAKTSNTPGRTRLVNYFDFGEFVLADLPGYGYAEVSKAEKEKWAKTLDAFFESTDIAHVFALVDLRHLPSREDVQMVEFLYSRILPFTIVTTKADKLPKTRKAAAVKEICQALKLGKDNVIVTSSQTGEGKIDVLHKLDEIVSANILLEE